MKSKIQYFFNNYINGKIATCCVIGLLLSYSNASLAGYKPSKTQRPPSGRTSTTGSRGGCNGLGETSLKLLAPTNYVGQTASKYPTFAWLIPETKSLPMEFRLYKYDSNNQPQLQHKWNLQTKWGIMALSLPKNQLGLKQGERYLWQVALLCDINRPSNNLVAMAEIDVVAMPSSVRFVGNSHNNVDTLAEAGLWYDALALALKTNQRNAANELLKDLAEEENLNLTTTSTSQQP
jgi:hypothetical protein